MLRGSNCVILYKYIRLPFTNRDVRHLQFNLVKIRVIRGDVFPSKYRSIKERHEFHELARISFELVEFASP